MDSTSEKSTDELIMVRDHPFSATFTKEIVEEAMDYIPHDGDIIIASYPKTGTTWMQYIVMQVLTKGEDFPEFNDMMYKVAPVMEVVGAATLDAIATKPRVYKHHMPYSLVKKNPKSKIINMYRNPEDTFVSYYHFLCSILGPLDFESCFEGFLTGRISHGSYFKHVKSFLDHKDDPNVLLVSYEKLKRNTREEVIRIVEFLGEEYYDAIVGDESVLNKILEHISFDYMKKNLSFTMAEDPLKHGFSTDVPQKEIKFFRKGTIGDGKKSLSEDKLKKIRSAAEEILKGTEIFAEWYGS